MRCELLPCGPITQFVLDFHVDRRLSTATAVSTSWGRRYSGTVRAETEVLPPEMTYEPKRCSWACIRSGAIRAVTRSDKTLLDGKPHSPDPLLTHIGCSLDALSFEPELDGSES